MIERLVIQNKSQAKEISRLEKGLWDAATEIEQLEERIDVLESNIDALKGE